MEVDVRTGQAAVTLDRGKVLKCSTMRSTFRTRRITETRQRFSRPFVHERQCLGMHSPTDSHVRLSLCADLCGCTTHCLPESWDSKIVLRVPWDSEQRMTVLARTSGNLQSSPFFVRLATSTDLCGLHCQLNFTSVWTRVLISVGCSTNSISRQFGHAC
jgi:hypothetical protein